MPVTSIDSGNFLVSELANARAAFSVVKMPAVTCGVFMDKVLGSTSLRKVASNSLRVDSIAFASSTMSKTSWRICPGDFSKLFTLA